MFHQGGDDLLGGGEICRPALTGTVVVKDNSDLPKTTKILT